jgi:DNA-directed RNA polymerase specialized sigma24 family protein
VSDLTDRQLRELLIRDPIAGWRAFVDQYTPTLLSLIERAGISDHDEAIELYISACERLSADDCARLRRHDPGKGALGAWLSAVMRNVVVDWVRSRAGRRRLFHAVEALPAFERQVFELFYWNDRTPAEICGILETKGGRPVRLPQVMDALEAIDGVLNERHRRELLALSVRSRPPISLEAELEQGSVEPVDPRGDPERTLRARELARAFDGALTTLPPEDAAILRLKYGQGLTHRDIQRALHLDRLTDDRVKGIVARLRGLLSGTSPGETPEAGGLSFLDRGVE